MTHPLMLAVWPIYTVIQNFAS